MTHECRHRTSRSRQGFQTRIWSVVWLFLHVCSLNYPCNPTREEQEHYYMFFQMLAKVLPCSACRASTAHFYTSGSTKLTMNVFKSRTTLALWLWRLHNRVNKRLNKKCNLSFKQMCQKYEAFRASCDAKKHGCEAPAGKVKKRAVVVLMTDDQFADLNLTSTIVNLENVQLDD